LSLKQKKGKLSGYCYRLFIIGDTVYYNLLKVNAKIDDGMLVVEDERSVSNNFEISTKGIKTKYLFKISDILDTASVLPGTWQTSFWKDYMPLKGNITVIREKNYKTTQIYSRMADLSLLTEMELEAPDQIAKTEEKKPAKNKNELTPKAKPSKTEEEKLPDAIVNSEKKMAADNVVTTNNNNIPANTNESGSSVKTIQEPLKAEDKTSKAVKSVSIGDRPQTNPPAIVNTSAKPATKSTIQAPVNKEEIIATKQNSVSVSELAPTAANATAEKPALELQRSSEKNPSGKGLSMNVNNQVKAISDIALLSALQKRKSEAIQTQALMVYEDTVTLSIYDNGEIDGDTVSVFINDEQMVSKISLSAQAYKINIPIYKGRVNKVELFAENLGRIPPNTGLLVIYTGDQRYQIFFTATLEKNAVIYLERRE